MHVDRSKSAYKVSICELLVKAQLIQSGFLEKQSFNLNTGESPGDLLLPGDT